MRKQPNMMLGANVRSYSVLWSVRCVAWRAIWFRLVLYKAMLTLIFYSAGNGRIWIEMAPYEQFRMADVPQRVV